jgi:transcriptional regulator of acetoin/glycerol metabolism
MSDAVSAGIGCGIGQVSCLTSWHAMTIKQTEHFRNDSFD